MNNHIPKILIILILFSIPPFYYSQNYQTNNDLLHYNQDVIRIFDELVANRNSYKYGAQKIDSLKNSSFSKLEPYNELVTQVLNCILEGIINNDPKLIDSQIRRGYELIKIYKLKLNTMGNNSSFSDGKSKNYLSEQGKMIKNYKVQTGDNLWKIAQKVYDNGFEWIKIYNINKNLISNPDFIYPNQEINIPTGDKVNQSNIEENNLVNKNNINTVHAKDTLLFKEQQKAENDIEISGMIVDQTQSKWGKDFFDLFNANWNPPENITNYTVTIAEKVMPGLRTQVIININGDDIYQSFIQPRYENIFDTAVEVADIVSTYLKNYDEIQAEIQGNDLKGSGIY